MPRPRKNTDFSFWEHHGWLKERDIVIVGAGFVGLSAAVESRKRLPDARITILESSPLNGGGSTKNAGFACFGSPSELLEDLRTLGEEKTLELVKKRYEGLESLKSSFSAEQIGYDHTGSVEMFTSEVSLLEKDVLEELPRINSLLKEVFSEEPFQVVAVDSGLCGATSVISSTFEGIIDTAKLYRAALKKAVDAGVDILNGVKVESIYKSDGGWSLDFTHGEITTKTVLVANNSMGSTLVPGLDVAPRANRVLVTAPIEGLKFRGSCHYDRGYVYLRRIDSPEGPRMLIGGGRQWGDGESEEVKIRLMEFLREHVEGAQEARYEYDWLGYLGVGRDRNPIVMTVEPGIHVGVRMGGMGVAIGGVIGRELAQLV